MNRNSFLAGALWLVLVSVECRGSACDTWQPFGTGMNSHVQAVTTYNGNLIAGGTFTNAGGQAVSRIAQWNGASWQPLGLGVWPPDVATMINFNGDLIVAGSFTQAGGASANRIARWNGSTWQSLGSGMNNHVAALAVYNGQLIAAGQFTTASGVSVTRIARWNGLTWQSMNSLMDSNCYAMTVFNGELIVSGAFTVAGGLTVNRIARWNGSVWRPLGTGMDFSVSALTIYNGELIATGDFANAGGQPALRIAKWNGSNWMPLGSGLSGGGGTGQTLTVFNQHLVVGGNFTMAGGLESNRLARWDGSAWHPWGVIGPVVYTSTVHNGELVIGGSFGSSIGLNDRIAHWTDCIPNKPPMCAPEHHVTLWPPDATYRAIDLTQVVPAVDPDGDKLVYTIQSITQDEPVDNLGDGHTECDGYGVGVDLAIIRAERSGTGNGRVYSIHYSVADPSGATCDSTIVVDVPHDDVTPSVDDGQQYHSCPAAIDRDLYSAYEAYLLRMIEDLIAGEVNSSDVLD